MIYYRKKAQAILEYALLLAAIIAIVIAVLFSKGGIKSKVQSTYNKIGTALESTTNDFTTKVFR